MIVKSKTTTAMATATATATATEMATTITEMMDFVAIREMTDIFVVINKVYYLVFWNFVTNLL